MDPVTIFGLLLSVIPWLRSEVGGRKSTAEILAAVARVEDAAGRKEQALGYIAWFQKQNQQQLIAEIQSSKTELMVELESIKAQGLLLMTEVLAQSGSIRGQLDALNAAIRPPVLSPIPLPTRASENIRLRGRDTELARLNAETSDLVISGQPGTGKTWLLQEYARSSGAMFLITDSPDIAAGALAATPVPILIVDDAATKTELVRRIRHARDANGWSMRIILTCWPHELADVRSVLGVSEKAILTLNPLPRAEVAEVVRDTLKSREKIPNDPFLAMVLDQARGNPGLAALISASAVDDSLEAVLSGELLLQHVRPILNRLGRSGDIDRLAAFALSGDSGMKIAEVATALGDNRRDLHLWAQQISTAGVLHQLEKDRLAVVPRNFRAALIRDAFFPLPESGRIPQGQEVLSALETAAPSKPEFGKELLRAVSFADADIPTDFIRARVGAIDDRQLWSSCAWLNPEQCRWVTEQVGFDDDEVVRAALHHIPFETLPRLLQLAKPSETVTDQLNGLRVVFDWIRAGYEDAFSRRKLLHTAALNHLAANGLSLTMVESLSRVFDLEYQDSSPDPVSGMTIHIKMGSVPEAQAAALRQLWEPTRSALLCHSPDGAHALKKVVEAWLRSKPRSESISESYLELHRNTAALMLQDLVGPARSSPALAHWVSRQAQKRGIPVPENLCPEEFLHLHPVTQYEADWRESEATNHANAEALGLAWGGQAVSDVVTRCIRYDKEAALIGNDPDPMAPILAMREWARALHARGDHAGLSYAVEQLPARYASAFLLAMNEVGALTQELLDVAYARQDLSGAVWALTLITEHDRLFDRFSGDDVGHTFEAYRRALRGEIREGMLIRLLSHQSPSVRGKTAIGMMHANSFCSVSPSLLRHWRSAILLGISAEHDAGDYHLEKACAIDARIARELTVWLIANEKSSHYRDRDLFKRTLRFLGFDERRDLLIKSPSSEMVQFALAEVVADSPELYEVVLRCPELKPMALTPLAGSVTRPHWADMARRALAAGFSPSHIAFQCEFCGVKSGPFSKFYSAQLDNFRKLKVDHPDLEAVCDQGIRWAQAEFDKYVAAEHKESVYGLS